MPTPQQGKIIVNGIEYGGTNQIDDTTTSGGTTWSSTKIYDEIVSMLPTESASGAVASFETPLTLPLVSHNVTIEPVQAGTGDPSPSNVRPISGWSEMNVTRTGANIWDEQWEVGSYTSSGNKFNQNDVIRCSNKIPIRPNTTYIFIFPTNSLARRCFYNQDGTFLSYADGSVSTFITPPNAYFMTFNLKQVYGTTYNNDISINYPATDTDYHAYTGQTYSRTFLDSNDDPITVYGGSENLKTGEGTSTKGFYIFTGSESWVFSSDQFFACQLPLSNDELFKNLGENLTSNGIVLRLIANGKLVRAYISDNTGKIDTTTDMNTVFVNGSQFCYELATPQTFHTDPLNLDTLEGVNNIWADTGDTAVEFKQDIQTYIDSRLSSGTRSLSLAKAPVETKEETKQEEQEEQNDDAQR